MQYRRSTLWLVATALIAARSAPAVALPYIDAAAPPFNIVADGSTPMDAQLAAAVSACGTAGNPRSLWLPAGVIVLAGAGNTTINLKDCHIIGQGIIGATSGDNASFGTTIALLSTTVQPFQVHSNWSIEGVNFYWPNQTSGTAQYPPLFLDTSDGATNVWLDHVSIINAYDGFVQSSNSGGWGAWHITDSHIYALNDLFRAGTVGDTITLSNLTLDPGAWLALSNFSTTVQNAINTADQVNSIFHLTAPAPNGSFSAYITFGDVFAWGYGFKLDANAFFTNSRIDVAWDGVATYIDNTSGGNIQNVVMSCSGCVAGIAVYPGGSGSTGNRTVFNLGANGSLSLNNFELSPAPGSFIQSAGASVRLDNVNVGFGAKADTTDYYAVNMTANSSGTGLIVRNSSFGGVSGNAHSHGIRTAAAVGLNLTSLENNDIIYTNDAFDLTLGANNATLVGNTVRNTAGAASVLTHGSGTMLYANNQMDKPTLPAITNCGSGAVPNGGPQSGFIQVGATTPTTSCTMTLPWTPLNGVCTFTGTVGGALSATVAGTPPSWTITSASDMHGGQIFFSCPGQQ